MSEEPPDTIIVTGGRHFSDGTLARRALNTVWKRFKFSRLVHGACSGADTLCARIASESGDFEIEECPADWNKYGRAAGPIRNRRMIQNNAERTHCLLAFPGGSGTISCVKAAEQEGVHVVFAADIREELI